MSNDTPDTDKFLTEILDNLSNITQELMSENCTWSKHTITVELPDPLFHLFDTVDLPPEEVKIAMESFVNSTIKDAILMNMSKVKDLTDSIKEVSVENLIPGFNELMEGIQGEMKVLNDRIKQFNGATTDNSDAKNTKNST